MANESLNKTDNLYGLYSRSFWMVYIQDLSECFKIWVYVFQIPFNEYLIKETFIKLFGFEWELNLPVIEINKEDISFEKIIWQSKVFCSRQFMNLLILYFNDSQIQKLNSNNEIGSLTKQSVTL